MKVFRELRRCNNVGRSWNQISLAVIVFCFVAEYIPAFAFPKSGRPEEPPIIPARDEVRNLPTDGRVVSGAGARRASTTASFRRRPRAFGRARRRDDGVPRRSGRRRPSFIPCYDAPGRSVALITQLKSAHAAQLPLTLAPFPQSPSASASGDLGARLEVALQVPVRVARDHAQRPPSALNATKPASAPAPAPAPPAYRRPRPQPRRRRLEFGKRRRSSRRASSTAAGSCGT